MLRFPSKEKESRPPESPLPDEPINPPSPRKKKKRKRKQVDFQIDKHSKNLSTYIFRAEERVDIVFKLRYETREKWEEER